jgi:hypothetical protein
MTKPTFNGQFKTYVRDVQGRFTPGSGGRPKDTGAGCKKTSSSPCKRTSQSMAPERSGLFASRTRRHT